MQNGERDTHAYADGETENEDTEGFGTGDKVLPDFGPVKKTRRDAEAIADGDESFPLNGLPCVDLHLLSTQEAG